MGPRVSGRDIWLGMVAAALLSACLALFAHASPAQAREGGKTSQRAPSTRITAAQIDPVTRSARFSFKGKSDAGKPRFECSLDGTRFRPCRSPRRYSGLSFGGHSFRVRATSLGSRDRTPARRSFVFGRPVPPSIDIVIPGGPEEPIVSPDLEPPTAFIDSAHFGFTNDKTPTFTFHTNEPATFECSLDQGAAAYAPCTSPYEPAAPLADGAYTFRVRATDTAGNEGAPGTRAFTLDATSPTVSITAGPTGTVASNDASFSFSSADGGQSFLCKLDTGPSTFCTSPQAYTGLTDGPHSFEVVAYDAASNPSSPATRTWTVDTTP